MHCTNELIHSTASLQILVDILVRRTTDAAAVKRGVRLILHRLSMSTIPDEALRDWLLVLSRAIVVLRRLGHVDVRDVAILCIDSETTKSLCSPSLTIVAREGMCVVLTDMHQF